MTFSITITYGYKLNYYPLQLHRFLDSDDYDYWLITILLSNYIRLCEQGRDFVLDQGFL